MAETLYTRALVRAAETEGSTQALASVLRVPENTLLRWMAGRAQMPLQAFLKTIELIAADERKQPPPQPAERATGKLRFNIGELEAHCARCGGHEFVQTDPSLPLRYIDELVCCSCGERVTHGDLVAQLAKDAVHHTKASTVSRQKRHAALRKKGPKLRLVQPESAPPADEAPGEERTG